MTITQIARFFPQEGNVLLSPLMFCVQRTGAAQSYFECEQESLGGTLTIKFSNEFAWLANKLVVLSITRSTAEQRKRVAEQERANLERAEALRAQEEAARKAALEESLKGARGYIRTSELLEEAADACPDEALRKQLRQIVIELLPHVSSAKSALADAGM